jgi:hypothetical protein
MRPPLFVMVASGLAACGGPLSGVEGDFAKGQYPAAHQALLGLEMPSRSWSFAGRAEYALYRGLTLVALGDRGRARVWLLEAKAAEDREPGSLVPADARRLYIAIESNELP